MKKDCAVQRQPMTRKLAYIGFSYVCGLLAASFLSPIPAFALAAAVLIIAAAYTLSARMGSCTIPTVLLCAALGVTSYACRQANVYEAVQRYDGEVITLTGRVYDVSEYGGDRSGYIFSGRLSSGETVRISCFAGSLDCRRGDRITVSGKAARLEDDFSFPEESYYKAEGVCLKLKSVTSAEIAGGSHPISDAVESYREYLGRRIAELLPNDEGAVLSAMLFGDKSGISEETRTLLYRSGIGHVMAVSGVHIAMLVTLANSVMKRIRIHLYVKNGICAAMIVGFVLLAGGSASVIRSALMVGVMLASDMFRRRADSANSLGLAMLILTVFSPYVVRSPSFLLSAAGVIGVAVIAPIMSGGIEFEKISRPWLRETVVWLFRAAVTSSCAALTVFPVSMLFFDEVSIVSPVTNILLIPICSAALVFGLAFALLGGGLPAYPCVIAAGALTRLVTAVSELCAGLRFTYIPLGREYLPFLAVGAVALTALSAAVFRRRRAAVIAVCLSLVGYCAAEGLYGAEYAESMRIAVLGNGTNSAMVVVNGSQADVISLSGGGNASADAVKYLNRMGIYKVESVLLGDNASAAAERFAHELELFDVGQEYVPQGTVFAEEDTASDCAVFEDGSELSAGGRARIRTELPGRVTVSFGEFSLLAADSAELIRDDDAFTVTIVEKGGTDPPPACEALVLLSEKDAALQDCCGGYCEIIADRDGKFTLRGLENGIGQ